MSVAVRWASALALGLCAAPRQLAAQPATASEPVSVSEQVDATRSNPASVEAKIETLTRRIEAQERENAELREQLAEVQGRLEQGQLSAASSPSEDAALADLLNEGVDVRAFEPSFRIYGFTDVGLQRSWGGFFDAGLSLSNATTFLLGNVNMYFDAVPVEHWRVLTELRFTTLPDGAETSDLAGGNMQRISTGILDNTSSAGGVFTLRLGGLVVERAQVEWSPSELLSLRAGYFLTPYGIWNVDHGSPTRIMLRPPLFVSIDLWPEHQTGVELYGVIHLLPWDLGYSLYVSNGRMLAAADFTDNKAFGGRLVAKTRRPVPMQFGLSFFHGTTENYTKSAGVDAAGNVALLRKRTIAYAEWSAGADASLDLGSLRVRAEFLLRRIDFEPGKRSMTLGIASADTLDSAGYVLLAYRLPWLGLEPIAVGEFLRYPTASYGEDVFTGAGGLNVYFNAAVTLRMQYSFSQVVDFEKTSFDHSQYNLHILASRLVVAF